MPGVQYVDYSRDLFMDMPILLETLRMHTLKLVPKWSSSELPVAFL